MELMIFLPKLSNVVWNPSSERVSSATFGTRIVSSLVIIYEYETSWKIENLVAGICWGDSINLPGRPDQCGSPFKEFKSYSYSVLSWFRRFVKSLLLPDWFENELRAWGPKFVHLRRYSVLYISWLTDNFGIFSFHIFTSRFWISTRWMKFTFKRNRALSVSYTHLTLPTIYSV